MSPFWDTYYYCCCCCCCCCCYLYDNDDDAACMVRHLGISSTILLQSLTSIPGFVFVLRTDSNFSYLAVDLTRTTVGLSSLLVRWYGIRYLTNSETRRVVQTVLNSSLRQSCSVSTNVISALEVSLNDMRYINSRFTLLYFSVHRQLSRARI